MDEIVRHMLPSLTSTSDAFRVTVVTGPRQSGKSTLLRQLHARTGGVVLNLDDPNTLEAVLADPLSAVSTSASYVFVDEVQRGGDVLVRAVKLRVDDPANRTTFVLAGSTNFLTVSSISESLAGRAALLEVWPLSLGEQTGTVDTFLDRLLEGAEALRVPSAVAETREQLLARVVAGGYPEPLTMSPGNRETWFDSYVQTVTGRDLGGLPTVRRPAELTRLLTYLAGHTAHELVTVQTANEIGLERGTLSGYLALLEQVFLVRPLPAWSGNPLGKVVRRPKMHMVDTGLACSLHGVDLDTLTRLVSPLRGQLLETYVVNELVRQRTWAATRVSLSHWRDSGGAEVDVVVEKRDGTVAALEVKASATVGASDFRALKALQSRLPDQVIQGVVLYLGQDVRSFGPGLTAVPVSSLAAGGPAPPSV